MIEISVFQEFWLRRVTKSNAQHTVHAWSTIIVRMQSRTADLGRLRTGYKTFFVKYLSSFDQNTAKSS